MRSGFGGPALRLPVRLVIAAAGLALAHWSGTAASRTYDDMRAYERALHCGSSVSPGQRECIATIPVTVVKRRSHVVDNDPPDPDPFPHQPPQMPPMPPMGPYRVVTAFVHAAETPGATAWTAMRAAFADRIEYDVTVRLPGGEHRTYSNVDKRIYDQAKPGATVRLEMWRGRATRLTIGSASMPMPLMKPFYIYWVVAFAGMVLALAGLFHRLDMVWNHLLGVPLVGGALLAYMLQFWPAVFVVVPAVVAVAAPVWWLVETILDARNRRARQAVPGDR